MIATSFLILCIAGVVTWLITPLVIRLAFHFGLVDDPTVRPHPAHTHTKVTPRSGGLAVFFGIFLPLLFFVPINTPLLGIMIASLLLVGSGIWDDKRDRSPYVRFFINCVAAIIVIASSVSMPFITNPFGGTINLQTIPVSFQVGNVPFTLFVSASVLTLIWIVWTTNIVGWSGGVDGQLPGFVAIASFVIGLLSLRYSLTDPQQQFVTLLSFATTGAFLGFLPWNFYPQKIMPGYGGKALAGFLLAILSLLSFSKLGTALLVLAVPMTDAVWIVVKRLLAGKSPVWATSGHLHHHLLSLGWGKRRIAVFYWCVTAVFGVVALTLSSKQKVFAAVLIGIVILGFLTWINFFRRLHKPHSEDR